MSKVTLNVGPRCPLRADDQQFVTDVLEVLAAGDGHDDIARAIVQQAGKLDLFGELLARYPSPLEDQQLGARRRGLGTLVEALCSTERHALSFRAPTQAHVGRALNLAQINFFRMLWHVCADMGDSRATRRLRETAARRLRNTVYTQLVEEVLGDIVTDPDLAYAVRAEGTRHLAQLWGHRLTWRISEFLPALEATWEARARVRVIGGTLLGTSEMFQLLIKGADVRFVELLTEREHAEEEAMAFREFLFGRSSEELERLTRRMAEEHRTSIELDTLAADTVRDAGSIFYEFFQARAARSTARRLTNQPGPKRTAEGFVVIAWLEQIIGT